MPRDQRVIDHFLILYAFKDVSKRAGLPYLGSKLIPRLKFNFS